MTHLKQCQVEFNNGGDKTLFTLSFYINRYNAFANIGEQGFKEAIETITEFQHRLDAIKSELQKSISTHVQIQ